MTEQVFSVVKNFDYIKEKSLNGNNRVLRRESCKKSIPEIINTDYFRFSDVVDFIYDQGLFLYESKTIIDVFEEEEQFAEIYMHFVSCEGNTIASALAFTIPFVIQSKKDDISIGELNIIFPTNSFFTKSEEWEKKLNDAIDLSFEMRSLDKSSKESTSNRKARGI